VETQQKFHVASWLREENSVRLIVVHSEGKPPQIRKILSDLQEQGAVPHSSWIERLDQLRKDGDRWTPIIAASRSLA
jgi:tyrosine-protein phosphatase YwqE